MLTSPESAVYSLFHRDLDLWLLTPNCETRQTKYFLDLLTDYVPVRTLRSSANLLAAPLSHDVKTAIASHAFPAAAPKLWNNLPSFVKSSCSYVSNTDSKVIYLPKSLTTYQRVAVGMCLAAAFSEFTWRHKYLPVYRIVVQTHWPVIVHHGHWPTITDDWASVWMQHQHSAAY